MERRPLGHNRFRKIMLATVASAAFGAGAVVPQLLSGSEPAMAQVGQQPVAQASAMPGSFADLVENVKPAVVNISTTQTIERGPVPQFNLPPGTPEFFRRFFEEQQRMQPQSDEVHALGSGFIIDPEGYVVTNNHVIGEADEISVILDNGKRLQATVVGKDDKTDIALLKVEADEPLPYVEWGNDKAARVGDWVVAVGNPFGLGGSVTAGIISANGRNINAGPYDNFLQIDAAINRGNSGGPAFNLDGRVVGVNTAIYSPNGGSVGIGFAVPASLAKAVVDDLRDKGFVERGWLGVGIQRVTPDIAEAMGLDEPRGALVSDVLPDSPAAAAGLKAGDIIVAFRGEGVEDAADLPRLVAAVDPGSEATLTVLRNGDERQIGLEIGRMPESERVAAAEPGMPQQEGRLGLALAPLTPDVRGQFAIPDGVSGVVVAQVEPGSEAARKGVQPGDVILAVNQRDVSTPEEVIEAVRQARAKESRSVLLLVNRDGNQRFMALELADA